MLLAVFRWLLCMWGAEKDGMDTGDELEQRLHAISHDVVGLVKNAKTFGRYEHAFEVFNQFTNPCTAYFGRYEKP